MRAAALGLVVAALVGLPAPAHALPKDVTGDCRTTGPRTIQCGARRVQVRPGRTSRGPSTGTGHQGGGGTGGGGAARPTPSTRVPPGPRAWLPSPTRLCASDGRYRFCVDLDRPVRRPSRPASPTHQAALRLSYQARDRLSLPHPLIRMNPPVEWEQIVNLETWLWVARSAWREHRASASVPGLSVTATARPRRVIWTMGTGDTVVCPGPGTPYDRTRPPEAQRPSCSYTYRRSSAGAPGDRFTVTATIEWDAEWRARGIDAGGDLGTLRTTSRVRIRVAEIQALNT